MTFLLDLKASWLALLMLILGGCVDLHNINFHEVKISPDAINTVKTSPQTRAIHYSSQPLTFHYPPKLAYQCGLLGGNSAKYQSCSDAPPESRLLDFEDPISLVKNHFLQGISTSLAINNVHSISEAQPRSENQNRAL